MYVFQKFLWQATPSVKYGCKLVFTSDDLQRRVLSSCACSVFMDVSWSAAQTSLASRCELARVRLDKEQQAEVRK